MPPRSSKPPQSNHYLYIMGLSVKRLVLVAAFSVAATLSWYQIADAQALDLPAAVDRAMSHSPTIAQAKAALQQARWQYVQARSQSLPSTTASAQNSMQRSQNYSGYAIIGAPQANIYSQNTAQLGTQYTYNGGLSLLQAAAARKSYDSARANLLSSEAKLTNDVAAAYFDLATKLQLLRIDVGDVEYQKTLVEIAEAKERAGVAAGVDVLSAKAQLAKSSFQVDSARSQADDAREALALMIAAPIEQDFAVPAELKMPPLPNGSVDALVKVGTSNRSEIVSAENVLASAETTRRGADRDLWPQIQLFASLGNQFSPTQFSQAIDSGTNASRGTPGFWQVGINSTLSFPLVDWGARRANHSQLDAQVANAEAQLTNAREQVELDVRQAYRASQTAVAQLSSARSEVSYATEAARIARLQYQNGVKTITDVLSSQQAALVGQEDAYNASVAYDLATIRLRLSLGTFSPYQAVADLR